MLEHLECFIGQITR